MRKGKEEWDSFFLFFLHLPQRKCLYSSKNKKKKKGKKYTKKDVFCTQRYEDEAVGIPFIRMPLR